MEAFHDVVGDFVLGFEFVRVDEVVALIIIPSSDGAFADGVRDNGLGGANGLP